MSDRIHRELLRRIKPAQIGMTRTFSGKVATTQDEAEKWSTYLVLDEPMGSNTHGWGWLGGGMSVSPTIMRLWDVNELLEVFVDGDGKEQSDIRILSPRGMEVAADRIKDSELVFPVVADVPKAAARTPEPEEESRPPEIPASSDGDPLFTETGWCVLCAQKVHKFGQISHTKSRHLTDGTARIEERNRKNVPVVVGSHEAPAVAAPAPAPAREAEESQTDAEEAAPLDTPAPPPAMAKPFESEDDRQPLTSGVPLFVASNPEATKDKQSGVCRLCSAEFHFFAWISHAKRHIGKSDPVAIIIVNKKKVPVVTGATATAPAAEPEPEAEPAAETAIADPWEACPQHEWKETDDELSEGRTAVECIHCGVPGERTDATGEVYCPAT